MKLYLILLTLLCVEWMPKAHEHHHHGHNHGHHHGHDHEDHHGGENLQDQVKFRYSKQANVQKESDGPDFPSDNEHYGHKHKEAYADDHNHDHAHSHGDAEDHGHGHNNGHAEDHRHGHNHGHAEDHKHEHNHGHTEDHKHEHNHEHAEDHKHEHNHDHAHNHGDASDSGHAHSHGDHVHGKENSNHHEPANFKYSKQANVKHKENHDHGHLHDKAGTVHSHSHKDFHPHEHGEKNKQFIPPLQKEPVFWLEPLLATLAISAAPFLILFIVPLNSNSPENQPFLKVLLSFASGGLLGDAFLHLIPHAISPHAHDGSHSHEHSHSHAGESHDHTGDMIVGLWVLAGIIVFLIVEKLVRHIKGGHGHSHGHGHSLENVKKDAETTDAKDKDKKEEKNKSKKKLEKKTEGKEKNTEDVKVSAYLNLAADCTHNFTDGLAIGASFLVSRNVGLITTLTIFLHEIPHEIGDFAILVQSGCTKRKAMMLQLVTAVGAFAGCICGLLAEGYGTAASSWILPFTAGGFIYIATVSVIPELLEESKLIQSIKEILALLVGVFLMVLIALTE